MKERWGLVLQIGGAIMLALCAFLFHGCAAPHAKLPTTLPASPDFSLLNKAEKQGKAHAEATTQATGTLRKAFAEHVADTQPTSAFVQAYAPTVKAADDIANATLLDFIVDPGILSETLTVQHQSDAVYTVAVENTAIAADNAKVADHYEAAYVKESTSWFGGKLGRILWWLMWAGIGIGAVFLISQVLLSSFPGTGWINFIAIPIHAIGNIVRIGWSLLSGAFTWLWNEVALWHVPWGQPVVPTKTPAIAPAGGKPPVIISTGIAGTTWNTTAILFIGVCLSLAGVLSVLAVRTAT